MYVYTTYVCTTLTFPSTLCILYLTNKLYFINQTLTNKEYLTPPSWGPSLTINFEHHEASQTTYTHLHMYIYPTILLLSRLLTSYYINIIYLQQFTYVRTYIHTSFRLCSCTTQCQKLSSMYTPSIFSPVDSQLTHCLSLY